MQKKAHQPYLPYLESSSAGEKFPRAITPQKALMNMPFRSREKARYGQIDVRIDWIGLARVGTISGGAIRGWIAPMNTTATCSMLCGARSSGAIGYPIAQGKGS